jgi:hypothetical protein
VLTFALIAALSAALVVVRIYNGLCLLLFLSGVAPAAIRSICLAGGLLVRCAPNKRQYDVSSHLHVRHSRRKRYSGAEPLNPGLLLARRRRERG